MTITSTSPQWKLEKQLVEQATAGINVFSGLSVEAMQVDTLEPALIIFAQMVDDLVPVCVVYRNRIDITAHIVRSYKDAQLAAHAIQLGMLLIPRVQLYAEGRRR